MAARRMSAFVSSPCCRNAGSTNHNASKTSRAQIIQKINIVLIAQAASLRSFQISDRQAKPFATRDRARGLQLACVPRQSKVCPESNVFAVPDSDRAPQCRPAESQTDRTKADT